GRATFRMNPPWLAQKLMGVAGITYFVTSRKMSKVIASVLADPPLLRPSLDGAIRGLDSGPRPGPECRSSGGLGFGSETRSCALCPRLLRARTDRVRSACRRPVSQSRQRHAASRQLIR